MPTGRGKQVLQLQKNGKESYGIWFNVRGFVLSLVATCLLSVVVTSYFRMLLPHCGELFKCWICCPISWGYLDISLIENRDRSKEFSSKDLNTMCVFTDQTKDLIFMQSMTGQKASAGQILPAGRSLPTPGQKVFYLAIFDLNICNSEGIDICAGHLIREYIGYFLCLTKTINVFSKCNAENACICIFIFAGVVLLTVADPIKLFFFDKEEFFRFLLESLLVCYI